MNCYEKLVKNSGESRDKYSCGEYFDGHWAAFERDPDQPNIRKRIIADCENVDDACLIAELYVLKEYLETLGEDCAKDCSSLQIMNDELVDRLGRIEDQYNKCVRRNTTLVLLLEEYNTVRTSWYVRFALWIWKLFN